MRSSTREAKRLSRLAEVNGTDESEVDDKDSTLGAEASAREAAREDA
jgi:hypothetical protein